MSPAIRHWLHSFSLFHIKGSPFKDVWYRQAGKRKANLCNISRQEKTSPFIYGLTKGNKVLEYLEPKGFKELMVIGYYPKVISNFLGSCKLEFVFQVWDIIMIVKFHPFLLETSWFSLGTVTTWENVGTWFGKTFINSCFCSWDSCT